MCVYLDRLATTFIADCLAGLKGNQAYATRNAIERLHQVLGRRPKPADLTTANLASVLRRLARDGFTVSPLKKYRRALTRLAAYCHRRGFLEDLPQTPKLPAMARKKARKIATAPPGSLGHTFATVLIDRHLPTASSNKLNGFHAAISQFGRWLGHDATIDDVTEQALRSFAAARLAEGHNERYTEDKCFKLWRVCRMIDPDRFSDRRFLVTLTPPTPGTLREFFETQYHPLRMLGQDRRRYDEYQMSLRKLNDFAGHEVRLDELTDSLLAGWMNHELERGLKPVSVNGCRARLLALWRFAHDVGKVDRMPRLRKLREEIDAPDAWSEEELKHILAAPLHIDWPNDMGGIPMGLWFHALLLVCYYTSLRRGSLLKLRREHVNLLTGWLEIPGASMKAKRGKRLRLGPDAIAALKAIWLPERELLFPLSQDKTTLSVHFRRILDAAGIAPSNRKLSQFHKLRRTVATITAAKRGLAAASEILGHASTQMTLKYVDPSKLPGSDFTDVLPMLTGGTDAAASTPDADRSKWNPAQYLAEAQHLAASGHATAAAMTSRVALERTLRKRYSKRVGQKVKGAHLTHLIHGLVRAGEFTAEQAERLKKASTAANRAAHVGTIDADQLAELLDAVRELIDPDAGGLPVCA